MLVGGSAPYAVAVIGNAYVKATPDGVVQGAAKADWESLDVRRIGMIEGPPSNDFLQPFTLNNKKGYLIHGVKHDSIPAIYDAFDDVNIYYNVMRAKKDGLWGVIGPKNNIIFPFLYEEMEFSASPKLNLYAGKKNGKVGVLKPNGDVLIPFEYDKLYFTNDDFWCISYKNEKEGIIILDGSTPIFIPARYKEVPGNPVTVLEHQGKKIRFFVVETEQGYGFVREDGMDYFKDK